MEKLFPDPFLKNQKLAYLWINSVKYIERKYIETKMQTTCF